MLKPLDRQVIAGLMLAAIKEAADEYYDTLWAPSDQILEAPAKKGYIIAMLDMMQRIANAEK